jgi:hypothetical protein
MGYGFEVNYNPVKKTRWVRVDSSIAINTAATERFFPGQIVASGGSAALQWDGTGLGGTDGVVPMNVAVGLYDTTRKWVPYGVVLGSNVKTDTTANASYLWSFDTTTSLTSALQLATPKVGVEGPSHGDPAWYVLVELISPDTILKGRLFQGAWGTAITKYTTTAANAGGISFTTGAIPACSASLSGHTTWYCVKGAAQGIYRMCNDASTTAHTFATAFPTNGQGAIGDIYKAAAMRQFGQTYCQFDAAATYIDNSYATAYSTTSYQINVIAMDLSKDGDEYVLFQFGGDHFCSRRA